MKRKLEAIDSTIDDIKGQNDDIEEKLTDLDGRMDDIEEKLSKLDGLDSRMDDLDSKMDDIEQKLSGLVDSFDEFTNNILEKMKQMFKEVLNNSSDDD